jgi:hypothetical protein
VQFVFQRSESTYGHRNAPLVIRYGSEDLLMRILIRAGSICLSVLLAFQQCVRAQDVPPPPRPRMQVAVVEGEAMMNNIRERKATNVVVVVRDGNRRPLRDAAVTFTLPAEGPGASFANNAKTTTATTDADGYAIVRGIRPNATPGPYRIEVEAKHSDETATTSITQFNMQVESRKGSSGKWIALVAIVGGAAAGGAVAATREGKSSTPAPSAPTPIGITPGAGTVGAPR